MRVIHLTLSLQGGAGIACRRLHEALLSLGVDSTIWAATGKTTGGCSLVQPRWWRWRAHLDRWSLARYSARRIFSWWSNNRLPSRLLHRAARQSPDLLHLHWVGDGWIDPAEIAGLQVPVVWTLHDAWPFTGGCHYPADCERFTQGCGCCPQLNSSDAEDASASNHRHKKRTLEKAPVTIVTPSRWLAGLAARSSILASHRIEVVPNGLEPEKFAPRDRRSARESLGLRDEEIALLVFAGGDAGDFRKGADLVGPALASLGSSGPGLRILVVGSGTLAGLPETMKISSLGRVTDEDRLAAIYSAADAHVLPSRQDNLPNTAIEALACGCPVLAFAEGGMPEIVRPEHNGLLSTSTSAGALAALIQRFVLLPEAQRTAMRSNARESFSTNFAARGCAIAYLAIYRSMLSARETKGGKR